MSTALQGPDQAPLPQVCLSHNLVSLLSANISEFEGMTPDSISRYSGHVHNNVSNVTSSMRQLPSDHDQNNFKLPTMKYFSSFRYYGNNIFRYVLSDKRTCSYDKNQQCSVKYFRSINASRIRVGSILSQALVAGRQPCSFSAGESIVG